MGWIVDLVINTHCATLVVREFSREDFISTLIQDYSLERTQAIYPVLVILIVALNKSPIDRLLTTLPSTDASATIEFATQSVLGVSSDDRQQNVDYAADVPSQEDYCVVTHSYALPNAHSA